MTGDDWYNNRELFEKIQELSDEMKKTSRLIQRYNGIRDHITKLGQRVEYLEKKEIERESSEISEDDLKEKFRDWGGWIFALIMFVIKIIEFLA